MTQFNLTSEQEFIMKRSSRLVGRILSMLEMMLPEGKQLEQAKKNFQTEIYDFRNDVLRNYGVSIEDVEK